jgi:lysophospholipase L1-like esterase
MFRTLLPGLLVMAMSTSLFAQGLTKGDRIVFLGDSITQAGAAPGGYVTQVREALEKQELGVEVLGAGISGNKVPDLEKRLDRDVIAKKPTIVVIYIGINDVWHSQNGRGTPKDVYEAGLKSLIERIQKAGARPILCTATVIGEKTDGSNPLDKMLDEYCDVSRAVAKEAKIPLIDLRKACLEYLKANNPENKSQGILTTDTVHLNATGNKFLAEQMLAGLQAGDKQASDKPADSGKRLRHVVLFKFKADVTKEQIAEVERAFAELPKKIDVIDGFEWGTNNSPEGLAQGYTHCFLVTFRDEKGREVYLPHPEHKKFVDMALPRIESALVVDSWTP